MPEQQINLFAPDGKSCSGTAEFIHYSAANRWTRASLYALLGLVGGTVCIIVPIVHLVTTWGFPLLGVVMGLRAIRREFAIDRLVAACPHCSKEIRAVDRDDEDPLWQTCPHCGAKLRVMRIEPVPATTPG